MMGVQLPDHGMHSAHPHADVLPYSAPVPVSATNGEYQHPEPHADGLPYSASAPVSAPNGSMQVDLPSTSDTAALGKQSQVAALQQELSTLRYQQVQYFEYIRQWISSSDGSGAASNETEEPSSSGGSAQESIVAIYSSATCRAYIQQLSQCMEFSRAVERALRELDDNPTTGEHPPFDSPIESLGSALYCQEMSSYYASGAVQALPELSTIAASVEQRLSSARYELYQKMLAQVQSHLSALAWPPPLTESSDAMSTSSMPTATPRIVKFRGFAADHASLSHLLASLCSLSKLQMACERTQFSTFMQQVSNAVASTKATDGSAPAGISTEPSVSDGPLLWALSQLTAPLQTVMMAHFSPGTQAGRLDKPEWLFKIVVRMLKDNVPHVEALQPALVGAGLGQHYHACVEFARCMREMVKGVLRGVRLPALLAAEPQGGSLWLGMVDATIAFEAQIAPYLGAMHINSKDPEAEVPEAVLSGSSLTSLVSEPDFFQCWMMSELAVAQQKLLPVLEEEAIWKLANQRDEAMASADDGGDPPLPGWKREFNPPLLAERALDILSGLINRSRHIPTACNQRTFIEKVCSPLLGQVIQRLRDAFEDAVAVDMQELDLSSARLAASVTAVHFLHHQISELLLGPALQRLHLEQDELEAAGGGGAVNTGLPASSPTKSRLGLPGASPNWAVGNVVVRHGFTPVTRPLPVLALYVATLRAMHRDWCLFIAREMARGFGKLAALYRQAVEDAGAYPVNMCPADTVSPALLPALNYLQDAFQVLSPRLDSPSFRDIWRAVSVPANRFLFNYVATEARFTPAGAAQFLTDVSGMVSIFSPFTKRPAAHFRELLAACKLLLLDDDKASDVVRRMSSVAASQGEIALYRTKDPLLIELGVIFLSPQQILSVVQHRL